MRAALDELTDLQAREGGKHAADSRGGVEAGIGAIEQYAELAPLHRGRSLQGARGALDVMRFEPRGVAAVLVRGTTRSRSPARGSPRTWRPGNAVVFKPSERTPLSGERSSS